MHVQLQPVGTGREPTFERGHGVLRAERAAASVCKHAGTRRPLEEGHELDNSSEQEPGPEATEP